MPSAKALGKRRAVDLSSDEDDLAPTSVSNKRTRALSPVDPSSLLQQPPESPERPSPRLRLLSSPPPPPEAASAAETDAIRTTLGGHESTDDYVDEDEDDDEVIVVSNSRGPTRHGSQATQPQHLFTMPPGLSSSSSTAFVSTSQQQQQPSSSQYESAPFYRMTCPICMDPPKPMVVTNCGHALYVVYTSRQNASVVLTIFPVFPFASQLRRMSL